LQDFQSSITGIIHDCSLKKAKNRKMKAKNGKMNINSGAAAI
jgi:hypothetical protein